MCGQQWKQFCLKRKRRERKWQRNQLHWLTKERGGRGGLPDVTLDPHDTDLNL